MDDRVHRLRIFEHFLILFLRLLLSAKVVCNIRSLNSISSVCLLQSVTPVGLSAFFLVTESLCFHQCGIDIFLDTPIHNGYRSWMLAYCLSVLGFVICSSLLFWLEVRAAESVLRLRLWSGRSRNRRSILAWDKHVFLPEHPDCLWGPPIFIFFVHWDLFTQG